MKRAEASAPALNSGVRLDLALDHAPRFGPGMKTAVVAGCAWWFIRSLQSAKWVALLGVPFSATLAPRAATLPAIVVAMLTRVWLYEKSPRQNPPVA